MKNKFSEKMNLVWEKIKSSRRIQILLVVAFILIILVCYFSFTGKKKNNLSEQSEISSSSEYVDYLEGKLTNAIKNLDGIGNVTVAITLESGFEYVYAKEEEVKTTSSGTLSTSSLVLVSGQPVIVKEVYPKVKGVVVIASGAKDVAVKFKILSAIQTVLEISNDRITILN